MAQPRSPNMPSYEKIRQHYLHDGMSYRQIAEKYKVRHYSSVYLFAKRQTINQGLRWPLVRTKPRRIDTDSVRADLICYEIRDFCEIQGWTYTRFAQEIGMNVSNIHRITSLNRSRIATSTAKRIMKFILEHEMVEEEAA